MRKTPVLLLIMACAGVLIAAGGCGSNAAQYAQDARSSYISARAVLVGVQEFPSQMEELLRSGDLAADSAEAKELIDFTRDLLPSVTTAFNTVVDNCELLRGEGDEKYYPYADKLLELVDLNMQVMNAYTEFIGLSNSVLEGLPYEQNPQALMPVLNNMDSVIMRIQQLTAQIEEAQEEAEAIYRELSA